MRLASILVVLEALVVCLGAPVGNGRPAPKVMIVSMFNSEAGVWSDKIEGAGLGNITEVSIRVPGLFPLYPAVACVGSFEVCQVTVGMGEINAAASAMALALSPEFDLTRTYFLLAGVAGVNPKQGTLGSVSLARFLVQVALQHEIDAREMPDGFPTGYIPYGAERPDQYPTITYGTEVVELNGALRDRAYALARNAELQDSDAAAEHRERYAPAGSVFEAAVTRPSVIRCDVATSDVYYTGHLLSDAFDKTVTTWTNGTGRYCMTASEDSAVLASFVRASIQGLVDVRRMMVMRTGSNFDRPPPNMTAYDHLIIYNQNGIDIALENTGRAGIEIVKGVLKDWDCVYAKGVNATNYVGDIIGTLAGRPDFGLGSLTNNKGFAALWANSDGK